MPLCTSVRAGTIAADDGGSEIRVVDTAPLVAINLRSALHLDRAETNHMTGHPDLIQDLVDANHILFHQGVVDAFGHVSVRHPHIRNRFYLARNMAPASVAYDDILEFDLDVGIDRDDVEEVERLAVELGIGGGRAVGDSLHLLDVFRIITSKKKCIGERADMRPRRGGILRFATCHPDVVQCLFCHYRPSCGW